MTPEEIQMLQIQLATKQMLIDAVGYTGTILAAFAIAIPLLLRDFIKESERHVMVIRWVVYLFTLSIGGTIAFLLLIPIYNKNLLNLEHSINIQAGITLLPILVFSGLALAMTIVIMLIHVRLREQEMPEDKNDHQDEEKPTI